MTHAQRTTPTLQPIPDGYSTVTPWIVTRDTAALLDFLKAAFGAKELARVHNADGSIGHAEARIGDAVVMMFDTPKGWPETPAFVRLYLDDAEGLSLRHWPPAPRRSPMSPPSLSAARLAGSVTRLATSGGYKREPKRSATTRCRSAGASCDGPSPWPMCRRR